MYIGSYRKTNYVMLLYSENIINARQYIITKAGKVITDIKIMQAVN